MWHSVSMALDYPNAANNRNILICVEFTAWHALDMCSSIMHVEA